ncbi:MAG: hypothetical protein AAF577_12800 [Pseudomonadota bacterium]
MYFVTLPRWRLRVRGFEQQVAEPQRRIAVLKGCTVRGIPVMDAVEQSRLGKSRLATSGSVQKSCQEDSDDGPSGVIGYRTLIVPMDRDGIGREPSR